MNSNKKELIIKYLTCFCIAILITVLVIGINGFFTDNIGVNIQILSDGFFVSGLLFLMVAGMLFLSNEGAFVGIGFVLRNIVQAFVPMGRKNHEFYAQYRERVLAKKKASIDQCIWVTGLVFLAIGIIFTVIWYANFYNVSA